MIVRGLTLLVLVVSTNALSSSSVYAKIYDNVRKNSELYDEYTSFAAEDGPVVRSMFADRMLKFMNTSVDPCEDFFEYACGNYEEYVKNTNVTNEYAIKQMFTIFELEELIKDMEAADNIPRAIVEFYDMCMAHDPTQVQDPSLVFGLLDQLKVNDTFHWNMVNLVLSRYLEIPILYRYRRNPVYTAYSPLPFQRSISKLEEVKQFFNIDEDILSNIVEQVGQFEEQLLAEDDEEDVSESDTSKNKTTAWYTVSELAQTFPSLKLADMHDPEDHQKVKVKNDKEMKRLEKVMNTTTSETLFYYISWRILLTLTAFEKSLVELAKTNSTSLMCTQLISKTFPTQATGFYSTRYFTSEMHEDVMNMLTGIRTEIGNIFGESKFMKAKVKGEALRKLANIKNIVWAPNSVLNVSTEMRETGLKDMLFDSNENEVPDHGGPEEEIPDLLSAPESFTSLALILSLRTKEAINEDEWISAAWEDQDPFECNAFYSGSTGVIAILLGILGHPFYKLHYPQFYKYGNVGVTVGHELMHGFDSSGYKYDANFQKRQWMPARLDRKVIRDMECYYTLYKKKFKTDGALTMGENLADNVGLEAAFKAYKTWTESIENSDEVELEGFEKLGLDKFQMFFLSNAQSFCSTDREAVEDDSHAADPIRVLATFSNSKEFSEAFQCPVGSPMNPRRKCQYLI